MGFEHSWVRCSFLWNGNTSIAHIPRKFYILFSPKHSDTPWKNASKATQIQIIWGSWFLPILGCEMGGKTHHWRCFTQYESRPKLSQWSSPRLPKPQRFGFDPKVCLFQGGLGRFWSCLGCLSGWLQGRWKWGLKMQFITLPKTNTH